MVIVERVRPQMTIWRMRIACWIMKATNTHSEYVMLFCFSAATMVARTRLFITSYVLRLSCILFISEVTVFSFCNFIRPAVGQVSSCKTFQGLVTPNLLTLNVNYTGRTAPLTSKVAFYTFIQQI